MYRIRVVMGVLKVIPLLLVMLSGLASSSSAQSGPEGFKPVDRRDELVDKLNARSATIETIVSSFTQKKQLEFLDETIVSRGRFWFRRENHLRWAYEEPFQYAIIINGGRFYIKDGESVSTYDMDTNETFREINDMIIGVVRGNVLREEKFDMSAFENRDRYLVSLVPKESGLRNVISAMEIYFDKADLTVSEIIMRESKTDFTMITFFDKRFNETIPDLLFSADL
jgi:outer membrane lipoprotein-sorting protein